MSESHISRRGKSVALAAFAAACASTVTLAPTTAGSVQSPTVVMDEARAQTNAQPAKPEPAKDRRTAQQPIAPGFRRWTADYGRRSRPGWSPKQVQRMARKERNRTRNRKAHR